MHTGTLKESPSSDQLTLGDAGSRIMLLSLVVGVAALAVAFGLALATQDKESWFSLFQFSYLVGFCFFATLSLGGLFFVLIMHLTRGGWGVSVRRIAEILAMMIIPMFVLFLPIMIPVVTGSDALYRWNAEEVSELVAEKQVYLDAGFFGIRTLIYFAIWGCIAYYFWNSSLSQDENGDSKLTLKMQSFSAPMTLLFAMALVFASFDWEMSLEPEWFSTIFPVYMFAGGFGSCVATLILIGVLLQRSGRLTEDITTDNYHDLSKLTFAFVVFWGYIAFSQYLLIWYANIPEETYWFKMRQENGWQYLSLVLIVGHLFIPLLGIMARTVRRNKNFMFFAAIYMLVMHFLDHFWLVMPTYGEAFPNFATLGCALLCFVGVGGIYTAGFCFLASNRALIPLKDPRLVESLNYTNP